MTDKIVYTGGSSMSGLLGIVLVVLKAVHVIDWPWLWVLAPFWIPAGVLIAILTVVLIVMFVVVWAR